MSTALVPAGTDTAGGTFQILLRMQVHPGMAGDYLRVWRENAGAVEAHPANRGHSLSRGVEAGAGAEGGDVFWIRTSWTDEPSFREFESSPDHLDHRARLHPFRAAGSIGFLHVVRAVAPRAAVQRPVERPVEVVLHHRCDDPGAILAAYHEASTDLAGVPGLLGNELLRSRFDPAEYAVRSRWSGPGAFDRWEQGTEHKGQTAPLRPYRQAPGGSPVVLYDSVADYAYPQAGLADRTGACRVVLHMTVSPGSGPVFEDEWSRVADGIAAEPANLGQTLLRDGTDPDRYVVVTDWCDEPSFREFETGEAHVGNRRRLDRFRVDGRMAVATVVVDH